MSRGQVAVWLIVGLVLLLSLSFLYYQGAMTHQEVSQFVKVGQQWDVSSINTMVQSCLDKLATESVFYFGMVGDSRSSKRDFFTGNYFAYDDRFKVPYYFMDGKSLMPTKAQVQLIIGAYVDENMARCVDDFKAVKGFVIEPNPPKTAVRINDKTVDFSLSYPLKVVRGDQQTVLDDWSFRLESRLDQVLSIARVIVDQEVKDDTIVYWDFMTDVTRLGYNMTSYAEKDNTIIYRVVDPRSLIYFEPFVFQFANRVRVE